MRGLWIVVEASSLPPGISVSPVIFFANIVDYFLWEKEWDFSGGVFKKMKPAQSQYDDEYVVVVGKMGIFSSFSFPWLCGECYNVGNEGKGS